MHPTLLLLIAVVAALYVFARYQATPPARRAAFRNRALLIGGVVLLVLMVLRGQGALAMVLGALGLGARVLSALRQAQTLRGAYQQWKGEDAGAAGRTSQVRTRFIEMYLEHGSGRMTGVVLEGRFRDRRLEELTIAELRALHAEVGVDPQSRAVLDAYVERAHGEQWTQGTQPPPASGTMTASEARRILGVDAEAGREEIVAAHRRLVQKLHPDRGGSTYLAAQVNEAKRVLLEASA